MVLSPRDVELLTALCGPVRLFAREQVRTWWPGRSGGRAALRRLALLIESGLLVRHRLSVRPVLWPTAPLAAWSPGAPAADFDRLAGALAGRWRQPPSDATVYRATRRAANLLGGAARGRWPAGYQASHDLGVAAVYLHYRRNRPADAAAWRGEDELPRHDPRGGAGGRKRPDAVLVSDHAWVRAVEFGAGYPADRLREFHADCAGRTPPLPYEVW